MSLELVWLKQRRARIEAAVQKVARPGAPGVGFNLDHGGEIVSTSERGLIIRPNNLGFYSTLVGEYDQRPGNYYVVSHRQGRAPEAGFHRLAGPFATHREADAQVQPVREYAERYGGQEAFWQHYITARCEPEYAPKSFLGSDPRKWAS